MPQHVIKSVGMISKKDGVRKAPPLASRVLNDYEYWLNKKYGRSSTYLTNAKTFLKTYKQGGTVVSQLDSYADEKGHSLRSVLKRFKLFLEEKKVSYLINDLNERKVPLGNIKLEIQRRDQIYANTPWVCFKLSKRIRHKKWFLVPWLIAGETVSHG